MRILLIEIFKVFTRRRSYIAFVLVLFSIILLLLAVNYEAKTVINFLTGNLTESFSFQGNLVNGNLYSHIVLRSLWVHLPILIVLVTGDLIAGEYQSGTFRQVLSRPVSRFSVLTSKFIAGSVYVVLLILFLGLVSQGLGHVFLGGGDLLVTNDSINIFNADDTLWRFAGAYAYGILSMLTIASLAMMMSAIFDNSVSAILTSLAVVIILTFVSTFNIPVINIIRPFIFTTYTGGWINFFSFNFNITDIIIDAIILIVHIMVFYFIALYVFLKKDILT